MAVLLMIATTGTKRERTEPSNHTQQVSTDLVNPVLPPPAWNLCTLFGDIEHSTPAVTPHRNLLRFASYDRKSLAVSSSNDLVDRLPHLCQS
jgi:hypothetical protein